MPQPEAFSNRGDYSDPVTAADWSAIQRVKSRQVRLIVSIPALMFLYTMFVTIWLHFYLIRSASSFPTREMREIAQNEAMLVLYLGLAGALAVGGVGLLLAWRIVGPLNEIARTMRRVGRGELDEAKVIVPSLGELNTLGHSFNAMVERLQVLFRERDRQIRESASGTLVSLGEDGRVLATDGAFERTLGFASEQLAGKPLLAGLESVLDRDDNGPFLNAVRACLGEAARQRTGVASALYHRPHDHSPVVLSIRVAPMESPQPDGPHYLIDLRDISEMQAFLDDIKRADRLATVGTMAAGIAHEIRNPLASIRAMTQLLQEDVREGNDTSEPSEYLDRIESEVSRLERLVRSVMDFASTDEQASVPLDVNEVLSEVLETARYRVDPDDWAKIDLQLDLDPQLPRCRLEEVRFRQAMLNVVGNAAEALADCGGGVLHLRTRHLAPGGRLPIEVVVANDGPPVDPEAEEKLFQPFYTTKAQGTGLGLPIAYQIVRANGGDLYYEQRDGRVCFVVRLSVEGRMIDTRLESDDGGHRRL